MSSRKLFSTILVTGCGGDIALGLGAILKQCQVAERLLGCDIHDDHAGQAVFDDCFIIKRADDPDYLRTISSLLEDQNIDLVIPMAEPELRFYSKTGKLDQISGKPMITANSKSMDVGFDKLRTSEFLAEIGLASPWTKQVSDGLPPELPCIVKDRSGSGSRDVRVVDDEMLAEYYVRHHPDFIWQELLLPDDEEYTCGLYRTENGEIRAIIMRRKLMGGLTGQGLVVEDQTIQELLLNLAIALDLKGSINVQLRKTSKGPVVFEINPRFSSTIAFRHQMGFQDVLWSVQEKAGIELESYRPPAPGTRFYRLAREYIVY